jgi:hypothetical protein
LWVIATYVIAADLLPNLILVLVNSVGYLPYSDRPGPGWQPAHLPSKDELQFFLGFSLMLLRATAFYAVIFAVAAWILGFCRLPRWGLRVLATPLAFISAGMMMAAAGWMIAISSMGVYTAAACGALWGLLVFPRLVPNSGYVLPIVGRIALPVILVAAGAYWLVRPLLPNPALTNAKVEVIRRVDAGVPVPQLDLSHLGPSLAAKAAGLECYVSLTRMEFRTDDRNQVRVLLIIDDAQPVAHTFLLPRTGDAIYRQSHGVWKDERSEGRKSDLSVKLTSINPTQVNLQTEGPCCSSMAQSFAPYDRH